MRKSRNQCLHAFSTKGILRDASTWSKTRKARCTRSCTSQPRSRRIKCSRTCYSSVSKRENLATRLKRKAGVFQTRRSLSAAVSSPANPPERRATKINSDLTCVEASTAANEAAGYSLPWSHELSLEVHKYWTIYYLIYFDKIPNHNTRKWTTRSHRLGFDYEFKL